MNAEAHAWPAAPFGTDDDGDSVSGTAGSATPSGLTLHRRQRVASRPSRGRHSQADGASWNVLAQELVHFPSPARPIRLDASSYAPVRPSTARDSSQDAARAKRFGEAWLERELIALRYRADAGYPALERRISGPAHHAHAQQEVRGTAFVRTAPAPAAGRRRLASRTSTGLAAPALETQVLTRRAGAVQEATQTRAGVATEPRGLRRLLPGVATLAALAGLWAGAGMLSAAHQAPMAVIAGSVKTPAGYIYVVRPGDTLWSIATRLQPGGDPRILVNKLESQVRGGTLIPGSRLVLP